MKKPPVHHRLLLTIFFSLLVFVILALTLLIVGGLAYLLWESGILKIDSHNTPMGVFIAGYALASLAVGMVVSVLVAHLPLKPFDILINAMNRLASGDYRTRVELGEHTLARELTESFNTMAQELEKTEMLRADFVNNFSHEFKTPINSILGFARLLNREELPEAQRREYLGIIEEESARLSLMATRVLELTKVENQSILTDVTTFNLSEQIRGCVLLLERKWEAKALDMVLEFEDVSIAANRELLKQVWINLLDNAIKFSPEGATVELDIRREPGWLRISVKNSGSQISREDRERIFQKFYQADTSHAAEGTGIGLAIVKRIVELHGGETRVDSTLGGVVFTVSLPQA